MSETLTPTQVDIETLIGDYIAAWSEPDPAARRKLLESAWDDEGSYTDPVSHAANRAGLDAIIARFLDENPGAKFTRKDKLDHHHGHIRFYWVLTFASGVQLPGMDYGEVTPNGKLAKIVGFF